MSPVVPEESPTQPAPCAEACICGGRLTERDCDVRSDRLWAAILAEPGTRQPAA